LDFIPDQYHYLAINILSIAYALAQSYERRLRFLGNWRGIFTALAIAGGVFLAWDELFTKLGVWRFNERYLTGLYIGSLPIEEYGFFITVPFACLFVYEVLNYFIKKDILGPYRWGLNWFFLLVTMFLGVYFYPRLYTSVCFFFTATLISLQMFVWKSPWLGRMYLAYFVCLIPFLTMNGWLTGSFTEEPIVIYNNLENMGLRIFTIPFEDSIYLLGYMLLAVFIFERNRNHSVIRQSDD